MTFEQWWSKNRDLECAGKARESWNGAMEEAAKIAEDAWNTSFEQMSTKVHGRNIASAIRSLVDKSA